MLAIGFGGNFRIDLKKNGPVDKAALEKHLRDVVSQRPDVASVDIAYESGKQSRQAWRKGQVEPHSVRGYSTDLIDVTIRPVPSEPKSAWANRASVGELADLDLYDKKPAESGDEDLERFLKSQKVNFTFRGQ